VKLNDTHHSRNAIEQDGEAQLWENWHRTGDSKIQSKLSEIYLPYARALAAKCYARRVHNDFEFEEYFHFAVVGMMESLNKYAPGHGAQFKTFATPRINGSILNGLDTLSERQQQVSFRRRLTRERLDSLKTEKTITKNPNQLQALVDIGVGVALGFLLEGSGMLMGVDEKLPDNAYSHIELRQLQSWVIQLVDQLTEREAQVIRRHYLQQQSFDEIAAALQLTKGRISQLHKNALNRMRELVRKNEICNAAG
jgi:RNA polymerase sigma factor FliA